MVVSAVIVNYNAADLLLACLESVENALTRVDGASEIHVVDNDSTDGSVKAVRERFPGVVVHEMSENAGFPTAAAEGTRQTTGDWVLFLNNDATIHPDAVSALLEIGESDSRIGSVAAQMRFADTGRINSAGIAVDRLGVAFDR